MAAHLVRLALRQNFELDPARPGLPRFRHQMLRRRAHPAKHRRVVIAHLQQHFRMIWDDAHLAGRKPNIAHRPDGALRRQLPESFVDRVGKGNQRRARVPANGHAGGARMIADAGKPHAVLMDADDAGDDAEVEAARLQIVALLDVGFQISEIAGGIDGSPLETGKAGAVKRLPQHHPGREISGAIDLGFIQHANRRAAAEETCKMRLLIGEDGRVHARAAGCAGLKERPGDFQPIDDAHCAIEPASVVLRIGMRADEQQPPRRRVLADYVADPVHSGGKAGFLHTRHQPAACRHVVRRIGGTVDAGLVGSERAEPV